MKAATETPTPSAPASKTRQGLYYLAIGLAAVGVVWLSSPASPLRQLNQGPGKLAPYTLLAQDRVDPDQEIAFYRERIRGNPDGFLDLVSLAEAYLRRAKATGEPGWYLLAEQAARRSLKSFDNNPGALMVLSHIAIARHDFQEALALTNRVEKLKPGDLGVLSNAITIQLGLGEPDLAARAADALVKRAPGLDTYTQRALVNVARGRESEAIQDFQKAISLEQPGQMDGSAQARAWLGRLYARRGKPEAAEDLLREALRIQPRQAVAQGLMADLRLRQQRYDEADALYAGAYESSQAPVYLIGRAKALALAGQAEPAEALWRQAEDTLRREIQANAFGHRRDLARLLLERKRPPQEALNLMQAELKTRQDADTLAVMAWSLASAQKWAEARVQIQRLLARGSREAEYLYRAAQIETALGRPEQAKSYLQAADSLDPGFRSDPASLLFTPIP